MFLADLSHTQKLAYMSMATCLISSDGHLNEKEMLMIEQYKVEMELYDESMSSLALEDAIHIFADAPDTTKKRILFELLGLAFSDGHCAEQESEMIETIRNGLGLPTKYVQECSHIVQELLAVYRRIEAVVNG